MAAGAAAPAAGADIISRLDRLDNIMAYLEELRDQRSISTSTRSSDAANEGGNSSINSSPQRTESKRRPLDDVVVESQVKGSIVDRIDNLEKRLVKLQEEIENDKEAAVDEYGPNAEGEKKKEKAPKKGLRKFVKSCVRLKTKE